MSKHPSIEAREKFIIKKLYEVADIRQLKEFNKELALQEALDMQAQMEENITPYLYWQTAINTLVEEIKNE